MIGLTKRQSDVLKFIANYQNEHDITPTYRDISIGVEMKSLSQIHKTIDGLWQRGFVTYRPGYARTLKLTERAHDALNEKKWRGMATVPKDGSPIYVWYQYQDGIGIVNKTYWMEESGSLAGSSRKVELFSGWMPAEEWPKPPNIVEVRE